MKKNKSVKFDEETDKQLLLDYKNKMTIKQLADKYKETTVTLKKE